MKNRTAHRVLQVGAVGLVSAPGNATRVPFELFAEVFALIEFVSSSAVHAEAWPYRSIPGWIDVMQPRCQRRPLSLHSMRSAALLHMPVIPPRSREFARSSCSGVERLRDRSVAPAATIVIAAIGEPGTLLPPLVQETVGRDIGDQIFERLADLTPGGAPIDAQAYRPALASGWERLDSLTWRFHLRRGARWHDGRPVTSEDVRFSFDAFADSAFGAPARSYIAGRLAIIPEDSAAFLVRFTEPSSEQLYDATYHVRIMPAHVWGERPRDSWAGDTALARLVGSGPYHPARWERGQFLELAADPDYRPAPAIPRVIWRFTSDPDAALNLVLSHEADVLETAIGPERAARAAEDTALRIVSYPSAAFGFLGFNLAASGGKPHPVLGDLATCRGWPATDRSCWRARCSGKRRSASRADVATALIWVTASRRCRSTGLNRSGSFRAGWRPRDESGGAGARSWRSTSWYRPPAVPAASWRRSCSRCGRR
jgi:hypothetical protein